MNGRGAQLASAQCPLCGAPVSDGRLAELQDRLRQEEREKVETAMEAERAALASRYEAERDEAERRWQLQAAALRSDAEGLVEAAERRRTSDLESLVAQRETLTAALEAARADGENLKAAHEVERQRVASQVTEEITRAKKDLEASARASVEAELAAAASKEADLKIQLENVQKQHSAEQERLLATERDRHASDTKQLRAVLEQDRDERLALLNRQRLEEQEKWQGKVNDLQRSLDRKSVQDLGEWPEVDLFKQLKDAMPDDLVRRLPKGVEGADILIEVRHSGRTCGKIIVDSKNRKAWQNRFAEKLRDDRNAAEADHAILSSSAFPQGERDLCVRDDVIVVKPSSVVALALIIRGFVVQTYVHGVSGQQRQAKAVKLYEYLVSGQFRRLLASARVIGDDLEELDVQEKKAHDKVWQRRGTLVRKLSHSLSEVEATVSSIVEADSSAEPRAS